jgi:hypothetical protein
VKFTVSHVVEPVERGIARINETIHTISKNVKRIEKRKRKSKDDSYLIPLQSTSSEFLEAHDQIPEGSFSDSGLNRFMPSRSKRSTTAHEFEIGGNRWS